jgi:proteasome lid subunit RPN8/RPN11
MDVVEKTAELKLGSWHSPEANLTIDYPLEIVDEIRLTVSSSFHANTRGGVEVGGVFFGSRVGNVTRIAAWRPISCEHSRGGAFVLSEKDLQDLARMLESAKSDLLLKDLQVAGWFLSHTSGDLTLTDSDIKVYQQCFPLPWQFTMSLRPGRVGPTKAAFFVRDARGRLVEHRPEHEFVLEPLHVVRPRLHSRAAIPQPQPLPAAEEGKALVPQAPVLPAQHGRPTGVAVRQGPEFSGRRPFEAPRFVRERDPRKKRWQQWFWAIPMATLLLFAGLLAKDRYWSDALPPSLSLRVQDSAGAQLHIDWDRAAPAVQNAQRGVLQVDEMDTHKTIDLDASQLHHGGITYARHSGDVKAALALYGEGTGGPLAQEEARFVGPSPVVVPPPQKQENFEKERADLEEQIHTLRAQLAKEQGRSAELQNLVRVLETRLGLKAGK